ALIDEVSPTTFIARAIDAGYDPGSYKLPERSFSELGLEPQTYSQVVTSEYSDVWFEAMDRELTGMLRADAFALAALPPGRKAVGAKWVFKWKTDEMGIVTRAKARLVAKGFSQKPGIDYFETFALTPASSTARLFAAIANECDLEMIHFDAEQAFIQADIDSEVYVRLLLGCGALTNTIVRLNQALYGCKQSSRAWNIHLTSTLKSFGFDQSEADPCL
ncbi:unnamed protein product, partial [Discosporangium mesarthrocarpum]